MAANTFADLLDEASFLLQDVARDRYTEAYLLQQLNRGLQELGRIRPDAFFDSFTANRLNVPKVIPDGDTPDEDVPECVLSEPFPLEGQFYPPLVSFVVGFSEVQDDEFTDEGRAAQLLLMFRNTVLNA